MRLKKKTHSMPMELQREIWFNEYTEVENILYNECNNDIFNTFSRFRHKDNMLRQSEIYDGENIFALILNNIE